MPDNPYMVGGAGAGGPNYATPLLDWQGMAGGIGDALKQRQQQQPGQPGAPMDIRSQLQQAGTPPQGGQPNMPGGWGARLAQIFGLGQRPGMAGPGGQQFGGPQPPVPTAQGPTGLY